MAFNKKEYIENWKKKNLNYHKEWYQQNKEKEKLKYQQNKQDKIKYQQEYYSNNKEQVKNYIKKWSSDNKEQVQFKYREYSKKYQKQRCINDPVFKLSKSIRHSIYQSLRKNKINKNNRTVEILGCTFEEFKKHLESQFEPWMNWNNMGGKKISQLNQSWDIDHIIPISSAKTKEEIIKLNHYSNLRPLCSYTNRWIKRNKKEG